MSLIGSVSLTNQKDGVYLGRVNIDNYNIESNQIAYSIDGINLSGLDLGDSLTKDGDNLEACIFKNSHYVNDGITSIKSKVDLCSQADVVYISSGSYGESQILINNKVNIALTGPPTGIYSSTICEVLNGFNVGGTSDLIRFSNLQIKGSATFSGVGRYKFSGCVFSGSSGNINNIIFGQGCSKFISVNNCEFDEFCNITIPNTFLSAIYFINCGFNQASINLNNALAAQVIFNNCSGFASYPSTNKATFIGLNVLASGQSQVNTYDLKTTLINGSAYPPASGLSMNTQADTRIPFCTDSNDILEGDGLLTYNKSTSKLVVGDESGGSGIINTGTLDNIKFINLTAGKADVNSNKVIASDGEQGMKWSNLYHTVINHYITGAQTVKSGSSINLFESGTIFNKLPSFKTLVICNFNFSLSANNSTITFLCQDIVSGDESTIKQRLSSNGSHQIPITFLLPENGEFSYDLDISVSEDTGTISTTTDDYYNITIQQFRDNLD
jgi:hypothetical protein